MSTNYITPTYVFFCLIHRSATEVSSPTTRQIPTESKLYAFRVQCIVTCRCIFHFMSTYVEAWTFTLVSVVSAFVQSVCFHLVPTIQSLTTERDRWREEEADEKTKLGPHTLKEKRIALSFFFLFIYQFSWAEKTTHLTLKHYLPFHIRFIFCCRVNKYEHLKKENMSAPAANSTTLRRGIVKQVSFIRFINIFEWENEKIWIKIARFFGISSLPVQKIHNFLFDRNSDTVPHSI